MPEPADLTSRSIIGMRVHATSYHDATQRILTWATRQSARSVYAANVHVLMEARDNPELAAAVNSADLVTADGMPLVWALRMQGVKNATRVYGPDLTLHVCAAAAHAGIAIGLYGSTPGCLHDFSAFLKRRFPSLHIACAISPPFRPLTAQEDAADVARILESGARILFVGLGCPRQELWIARHRGRLPLVMLAVGAAFDFHAGRVVQAPRWVMRIGMEWLFRLCVEPKRLWKRYVKHNPRFVWLFLKQLLLKQSFMES